MAIHHESVALRRGQGEGQGKRTSGQNAGRRVRLAASLHGHPAQLHACACNDGNIAMTIAMTIHRRSALTLLAAAPLFALPGRAAAQNYPTRPVHLIVPYLPGVLTDVVARILANSLGAKLGQTIVVDNRPGGAAGTVGAHVVVSADPDGYTLLLNQAGSLTISPSLYKLDYDPLKAFAPIGIVASSPEILVVNPSVPAKSVPEFIAYAK